MPTHTVFRGDNKIFRSALVDENRDPVNIEGWTFKLSGSRKAGTNPPEFQADGAIIDAANGVVEFELTPAMTVHVGTFLYDVQAITAMGKIHTIDSGQMIIAQDVTV